MTWSLSRLELVSPELKMRAVVLGSLILMMTAAKRLGLYSAFLALSAIVFRSSFVAKLTVHTMFLKYKSTDFVIYFCLVIDISIVYIVLSKLNSIIKHSQEFQETCH